MKDAVVVTGGAGYIGSHICKALQKQGFLPIVIDNLVRGHKDFVKWGPLFIGNVGDQALLQEVFTRYKPLAVIHCAAFAYVHESFSMPQSYYRNNVAESLALLEMMQKHQIHNIIFSSTCATYGHALEQPITELHPQKPVSPYGRTKLAVEWILKDFAECNLLKYGILRYFNAAGADLEGEIGERHIPETHIIPRIIEAALGLENELVIYGNDFSTHDGTAIRDYIHVQDLAVGHIKALLHLLEGKSSFEVNLGSGNGTSIKEIILEVEKITARKVPYQIAPSRKGEPSILISSIAKAKSLLGWDPNHSEVSTILTSACAWIEASLIAGKTLCR